jgi:anti-sigma-K factor RskA
VNSHDEFRELVEGYALGTLDTQERAAFEAHLRDCAECAGTLEQARIAVAELAHLAPPAAPSEELKERLLRDVRADSGGQMRGGSHVPWWMWAGVAALLVFSIYSEWRAQQLTHQIQRISEQAALERQRSEQLQKEFGAAQMQARILTDPRSKKVMLSSKDPKMPQLEAMWNPDLGLFLMGHGVPMPGENRAFELWLIPKSPGSKPMAVHSLMWPDASGKLMHVIAKPPESMRDTKAIAVTEEPAEGSPEPTSEPMWMGAVS